MKDFPIKTKLFHCQPKGSVSPLLEMTGRWVNSCGSGIVLHWAMPTSGITQQCPPIINTMRAMWHLSQVLQSTHHTMRAVLMSLVVNLWLEPSVVRYTPHNTKIQKWNWSHGKLDSYLPQLSSVNSHARRKVHFHQFTEREVIKSHVSKLVGILQPIISFAV